ncbi:hypothetical protein HF1_05140 [Mycoplasma haemofelis str. Langford 1]|uniref:Uncharacterized protein n=1 Tax=Mycoplasma haemofelis (strain Langford 1) TaxID=941640 RepID=E8ZHA1_MYCHL|nr:hypothetical protein [Mycoplasma haemofelis]CBY92522.1 hypothetical protein HF1_05140 [Mycoplasma haemofelis str. Langford 1]
MNHLYTLGGLGVLGAASGGAYLIHNSISKPAPLSLKSKLENEKYSFMGDDDGNWDTVLSKYNESSISVDRKFADLTGTVTKDSLKKKCDGVLSSGDGSLYEKAKLWCTTPRSIQQRLEDLKIGILKMDGEDDNGDKDTWVKLKDKYKGASPEQKIRGFELTSPDEADSWKKIRTACSGHMSKSRWDADYDYYLEKAMVWCSSSSKLLNE